MHSNNHLGISLMGMAQVAAATPHLTYACDTHYQTEEDEVVTGGRSQSSMVASPYPTSGPGRGMDYDQLARGRMQNVPIANGMIPRKCKTADPNWERKLPRW